MASLPEKAKQKAGSISTEAGRSLSSDTAHRRTRESHGEELAEDYVEAIADCIEEEGEARAVDLARRFGVTHVSVIKAIKRLQRDKLVTAEPYRSIFLTERGWKLARKCRARHETVLEFLLAIGVPRNTALIDAEGIEHHVSSETLARFRKFLARRN